jgi:hypothetical protein
VIGKTGKIIRDFKKLSSKDGAKDLQLQAQINPYCKAL